MRIGPLIRFLLTGLVVGTLAPFALSLCLFGTTLQTFVTGGPPAAGFWSSAPTPTPTPIPSQIQAWSRQTVGSSGGAFLVLWSVLGAWIGQGLALRLQGQDPRTGRWALTGAAAGSAMFIGIALLGFLP